jgi:hypothetical protein
LLLAVKASTLVLPVLEGLKVAVTPVGSPVAVKATLLLEPVRPLTLMVLLALLPARRGRVLGEDERLKPDDGIVSAMVAVLVSFPLVPVTFTE